MKIYAFTPSPNCQKVLAVVRELALPVETVPVDIFRGEAKAPAFLAKNPNGRVPVLEDDGLLLWESNAILAYLASQQPIPSLLPTKPRERAEVDRWLFWQTAHLAPAVGKVAFEKIVKPMTRQGAPDATMIAAGTADFAVQATILDRALAGKEYVAGKLSIADFAIGPFVGIASACDLDVDPFGNLCAWRDRMKARQSVRQTMAEAQAAMRG
jgi:glutathione S-transferase